MNTQNIFLQGFKSKKSVNTSEGLNVSLKGKRKLLPTTDMGEVISLSDVYNEEREKCNKIRLTCQVNTVCSNVLYNQITEIVRNEGSSGVSLLNYNVINGKIGTESTNVIDNNYTLYYKDKNSKFWSSGTTLEAIRDTQLSNCGYVYHCGANIFNNHLVRSNTFKAICASGNNDTVIAEFNTIYDSLRNEGFGEEHTQVKDRYYFPISSGLVNLGNTPRSLHVYKYEDLYTYKDCKKNRLNSTFEGWVGFYNKSKLKTYYKYSKNGDSNQKVLPIDKPIMYLNGGDFVDMYPDRSLYSFVPKYNGYRNRAEKNWNYCVTYPSSSYTPSKDEDEFTDIIEPSNGALKAIYFNENTIADNGTRQLVIYSIAKHGLSVGDTVNIYNTIITKEGGKTKRDTTLLLNNAKVTAIADDFIFTVFSTVQISKNWVNVLDIGSEYSKSGNYFIKDGKKYYIIEGTSYINLDDDAQNISYKKVVNGIECDYYVRIFSRIPNFKFASGDTSTEYEIYRKQDNGGTLIEMYQDPKYDFENHVSRLAFAKNVYSDNMGEIVYTDDIDISNLRDNLGRPLTSIFLTIIKNNAGYKQWYGFDTNSWNKSMITADTVEFSHCFGRITCGIETSIESRIDDSIKSINKINPISPSNRRGFDVDIINGDRDDYDGDNIYEINQTEVCYKLDRHYYGDLCYYDNYNAVERSVQPILHRFNTAQRESLGSKSKDYFTSFTHDEIKHDDYDFTAFTQDSGNTDNCNNRKEGYYYNPHYEIRIKTFDKLETAMPDFLTITKISPSDDKVRFTCLENHYLSIGDKSVAYDIKNRKYYNCTTISGSNDNYKSYTCKMYDENGNNVNPSSIFSGKGISDFKVFKMDNLGIPSFARILKDGTCRVIWRNVLNNGFNMSDDTVEEYPFTNGAFYINKPINLYLKRQDPYNIWGLYSSDDLFGIEPNIEKEDNYTKAEDIEC